MVPISFDSTKNANLIADSKYIEEVFAEEGTYEELFAYDNREDEYAFENKRLNLTKRRRRNLPPITPKAAVKDLVLNLLFDILWSDIIIWSSNTIRRYAISISPSLGWLFSFCLKYLLQPVFSFEIKLEDSPSTPQNTDLTTTNHNISVSLNPVQRAESAISMGPLVNHLVNSQQPVSLKKANPLHYHNVSSNNMIKNVSSSYKNNNNENADGFLSIQPLKESNLYPLQIKSLRSYGSEYTASSVEFILP